MNFGLISREFCRLFRSFQPRVIFKVDPIDKKVFTYRRSLTGRVKFKRVANISDNGRTERHLLFTRNLNENYKTYYFRNADGRFQVQNLIESLSNNVEL